MRRISFEEARDAGGIRGYQVNFDPPTMAEGSSVRSSDFAQVLRAAMDYVRSNTRDEPVVISFNGVSTNEMGAAITEFEAYKEATSVDVKYNEKK